MRAYPLQCRPRRQKTNATDPSYAASRNYNIVEQVFTRELEGGVVAVVLFNRGEEVQEISVTWKELGLPAGVPFKVRDIWANNEYGADVEMSGAMGYSAHVPPHNVVVITVAPSGP
jgi:hypothetical protein